MKKQLELKVDGAVSHPGQVSPELVDYYVFNDSDTTVREFDASMTRQEFGDECDINVIMAKYESTGVLSHVRADAPHYVDFRSAPDFHSAMELMIEADKAFMSLPARVRREFDNDAQAFVDFAMKEENLDQMRLWGLAPPKPQEPPTAAPVAPSVPSVPPAAAEPPKAP